MKNFSTIADLILFQTKNFNNSQAFNFKTGYKLQVFSNQEFFEKTFHFACGLKEIGLKSGQSLANFSYQNPIWLIADLGSILAGAITVPIFHNISKDNLLYEISDAQVEYVFTDNADFVEDIKNTNPDLKIITYGLNSESPHVDFEELIALGKKAVEEKKYSFESLSKAINPQDLATIIYTSGSTGVPKGVELTHLNLISQIKSTEQFFPLKQSDVALSFLPLAHIFERMVMMFYISQGISIHFTDDIKNIGPSLKQVRPTLMTAVPRVLEKVFAKIQNNIDEASFLAKFLGQKAVNRALTKDVTSPQNILDKIFERLIYKKFRAALGGNMNMIICGGAALSSILERFYRNIGINLYSGYGLTEASPVLAVNCPKAYKFATVGKIFPDIELKIAQDGELLAKGPNIMRGYHKSPQKTAETMDGHWLKTGDLAKIDQEGYVTIIGRKKELFKTANGKYVSPVPIEQELIRNLKFLIGATIVAEGRKFTSALLFPDFEILKNTKTKLKFSGSDQDFLKSAELNDFVQKNITKINKSLNHCENIQKFHIITDAISIESGEITPSMKLKRSFLEEKYQNIINEFYN